MQDKAQEHLHYATNKYELVLNVARRAKNIKDEVRILTEERNKKVSDLLLGKKVTAAVKSRTGQELLKAGARVRVA